MNILKFAIAAALVLLAFGIVADTLAISEDQVVICINGAVIEKGNGLICREFMADYDHDRKISDLQQELYDHPDKDTFDVLTTSEIR